MICSECSRRLGTSVTWYADLYRGDRMCGFIRSDSIKDLIRDAKQKLNGDGIDRIELSVVHFVTCENCGVIDFTRSKISRDDVSERANPEPARVLTACDSKGI